MNCSVRTSRTSDAFSTGHALVEVRAEQVERPVDAVLGELGPALHQHFLGVVDADEATRRRRACGCELDQGRPGRAAEIVDVRARHGEVDGRVRRSSAGSRRRTAPSATPCRRRRWHVRAELEVGDAVVRPREDLVAQGRSTCGIPARRAGPRRSGVACDLFAAIRVRRRHPGKSIAPRLNPGQPA